MRAWRVAEAMPRAKQFAKKSAEGKIFSLVTTIDQLEARASVPGPPSPCNQSTGGGPRLVAADGFIDIGNSVVVAPQVEEQCIAYAERLVPMLQHAQAALERPTPASTTVACGPFAIEDVLIHLLSHLEPAELAHASAACAFWCLAARQVVLSSTWLSRVLGSCGMQLQVAGELGMTIDVDYAALEPFYDGQPSGTGLRCLRAVAASEVIVEYAGIALPTNPSDGTYVLAIERVDVLNAAMSLMNTPHDDLSSVVIHPAAVESLRKWALEASLDPHGWKAALRRDAFVSNLYQELPRVLDASVFGNVSAFIKDERDAPNCAIGWTAASILAGQPHAYVVALQDIAAGVEVSIDYGDNYDRHWL